VLDCHLMFKTLSHITAVKRACNYYQAQAIRHIRHLLTTELNSPWLWYAARTGLAGLLQRYVAWSSMR